ncbi:MAG: molybdopterin dinucleotide binding domain-containing protein, partial [Candidatus Velthaea sp.]
MRGAETPDAEYPLLLTTGRVADQWHTMTRTGHSPTLRASAGQPTLSCHPLDAAAAGLDDGAQARIVSRRGELRLTVSCDDDMPRGVAFAPFHWGALHSTAGAGALNALTLGAVDPTSAQPELKALAVRLEA